MRIIPRDEKKVTFEFNDHVEASFARKAVAPALGKLARIGFAFSRARSEAALVLRGSERPVRVGVPKDKLFDIATDTYGAQDKARTAARVPDNSVSRFLLQKQRMAKGEAANMRDMTIVVRRHIVSEEEAARRAAHEALAAIHTGIGPSFNASANQVVQEFPEAPNDEHK